MFHPELLLNPTEDSTSGRPRRELKVPGPALPPITPSLGAQPAAGQTNHPAPISLRIMFPWMTSNAATQTCPPWKHSWERQPFSPFFCVSNPMGKPELKKRRKALLLPHSTASSSPPTSAHASTLISPSSPAPAIGAAQIPALSGAGEASGLLPVHVHAAGMVLAERAWGRVGTGQGQAALSSSHDSSIGVVQFGKIPLRVSIPAVPPAKATITPLSPSVTSSWLLNPSKDGFPSLPRA